MGRTPEKALPGISAGLRLPTAASQPLPGACWVSRAAPALLGARFNRAASGSGGLPASFHWHSGASGCSGQSPEAVVRPRNAHGARHRWQGCLLAVSLSPSPG